MAMVRKVKREIRLSFGFEQIEHSFFAVFEKGSARAGCKRDSSGSKKHEGRRICGINTAYVTEKEEKEGNE